MYIGRCILGRDRMAAAQTYWRNNASLLAWQHIKIHQEELERVSAYKDVTVLERVREDRAVGGEADGLMDGS